MPSGGNNRINFQVGFNVDKSNLSQIQQAFKKIQDIKPADFSGTQKQLTAIKRQALDVSTALNKAFNSSLNSINFSTFKKQLGNLNIGKVYTDFNKLGAVGKNAFQSMAGGILTTNLNLKQTSSFIQNIGTTLMNTAKWTVASSAIRTFTGSISQAFTYVKSLDSSLNDIRIVTKDSADEMANFAAQANKAATELGRSTLDYTKAALTFYQQGLNDQQVMARTQATLKAQNITGAGAQMADYLTAVWNGYKVANEQAELYVDKLAAVADSSASNMSQLAVAMSKVASSANLLGVPVDSLNAQIATIVATTRQAPESVGNALKTIYSRINDISIGADDAEISLGNYSKKMLEVGVNVLDANGKLRNTGDVIEEIGQKWETLSHEQQIYLARTMAGQRQYNNLLALFENWGKYTDLVNVSLESQGATAEKNAIYMESLAAHTEQLGAAQERLKSSLIDSDSYKNMLDVATSGVTLMANFIQSIGGGGNALLGFGSIFAQVFSGVISKEINNVITNMQNVKANSEIVAGQIQALTEMTRELDAVNGKTIATDRLNQIKAAYSSITDQVRQQYNQLVLTEIQEKNKLESAREQLNLATRIKEKLAEKVENFGISSYDVAIDKIQQALDRASQGIKKFNINANNIKNSKFLDPFIRDLTIASKEIGETDQGLLNLIGKLEKAQKNNFRGYNGIQQLTGLINNATKEVDKLQNALNSTTDEKFDELNATVSEYTVNFERAASATDRAAQSINTGFNIQGIVKGIAGLGQFASGLRSIISLYDVWNNKNLSTGEKILQTFTNLAFSLPMIITNLASLIKYFKQLDLSQKEQVRLGAIKDAQQKLEIANNAVILTQQKLKTREKRVQLLMDPKVKAAMVEEMGVKGYLLTLQDAINDKKRQELALSQATTKAEGQQAIFDSLQGQENTGKFFAGAQEYLSKIGDKVKGIGSAIAKAFSNHPVIAWGTVALATIGGIIAYITSLPSELQKARQQANRLNQVAKDNYSNLSSISGIIQTISSDFKQLSDAENTLNNLTSGSEEWANQLEAVNQQVTELLQKYPQLKDYLQIGQNGQLGFREGAKDAVESGLKRQQAAAAASYVSAERSASDAQNKVLVLELADKIGVSVDTLTHVMDLYLTKGSQIFNVDWLGQELNSLLDSSAIVNAKEEIVKLINIIQSNVKSTDNLIATMVKTSTDFSQFEGFNKIANQAGQEAYKNAFANKVSNLGQADLDSKYFDDYSNIAMGYEDKRLNMDRVVQAYEKQLESALGTAVDIIEGQDGKFTYQYAGKVVDLTKEGIISGLAYFENQEDIGAEIAERINNLLNTGIEGALSLASGLENIDYSDLTKDQIKNLHNNAIQLARAMLPDNATDQEIAAKAEEIKEAYQKAYRQFEVSINNFVKGLSSTVQDAFNNLDKTNLTQAVQKQIGMLMQKAFAKGVDPKLIAEFFNADFDSTEIEKLSTLNFDYNTGSLNEFKAAMRQAGIITSATDEEIQAYINSQKELKQVTLETLQANYKSIHDIIDKLKDGDSISAEDAAKLEEAGINLDNFFDPMLDGSYLLTKSAAEFYNYANNISFDTFKQRAKELQDKIGEVFKVINQPGQDLTSSAFSGNLESGEIEINQKQFEAQLQILKVFQIEDAKYQEILDKKERNVQLSKQEYDYIANLIVAQGDLNQKVKDWQKQQDKINTGLKIAQKNVKKVKKELDKDVNKDAHESLANYFNTKDVEGYNKIFQRDKEAAEELAEQLLRFDAALTNVQKNYKEWHNTLNSEDLVAISKILPDITNAYSDLLNVDPSTLSYDFVTDKKNLEDFNTVLNGTEKEATAAYNRLQEVALLQIIPKVLLDDSNFNSRLQSIIDRSNEIQEDTSIEIGADINDQDFIDGLNWLINQSASTVEEANAILQELGVDATVQPIDETIPGAEINIPTYTVSYKTPQYSPDAVENGIGILPVPTVRQSVKTVRAPAGTVTGFRITGNPRKAPPPSKKIPYRPKSNPSDGDGGGGGGNDSGPAHVKPQKTSPLYDDLPKTQEQKDQLNKQQHIEELVDPYERITKQYERQGQLLDDLTDQQDKLSGKDRLKNLQQQNQELEEQNNILERRQKLSDDAETPGTTANLKRQLIKQFGNNIGFDSDGQVQSIVDSTNWATDQYNADIDQLNKQILQKKENANQEAKALDEQYERWRKAYNAKSVEDQKKQYDDLTEAEKDQYDSIEAYKQAKLQEEKDKIKDDTDAEIEKLEKQKEKNKEIYDERIKLLDDYQKRLKEDKQFYKEYVDNLEKQIENALAIVKLKVELKIETGDFERQFLDFRDKFIKQIGDKDFAKQAKSAARNFGSYLDSGELAASVNAMKSTRASINLLKKNRSKFINSQDVDSETREVLKQLGISDDQISEAVTKKDRKNLIDQAISGANENLKEFVSTVQQQLLAMQEQAEKIKETLLSAYDQLKNNQDTIIKQYERINDTIQHGAKLSQMIFGEKAFSQAEHFQKQQIKNDKKELNRLETYRAYWEKLYNETDDPQLKQKALQNMNDYTDQLRAKVEDIVQEAGELLQTRINMAIDSALDKLSGPLGYEGMQSEWDHLKDYDNSFLDVAERKMGIEQIERLYEGVAKSLKAGTEQSKKFNEFQNKILKQLKEKKVLTQYDLDRAKAALEVEKAKYALQQAREKKVELRLRRDSQGNYTYQYVAEEEALEDKTAELQQKVKNLYQLDKDAYISNVDDMQKRGEQYIRTMAQLQQQYNQARAAGDEEAMARLKERMNMEKQQFDAYWAAAGENNKFISEIYLPESYGAAMGKSFASAQQAIDDMQKQVPIFNSAAQQYIDAITGEGGLTKAFSNVMTEIKKAQSRYNATLTEALGVEGIEKASEGAYKIAEGINNLKDAETNMITEYDKVLRNTQKQINQIETLSEKVGDILKDLRESATIIQELFSSYNMVQKQNDYDSSGNTSLTSKYKGDSLATLKTKLDEVFEDFNTLLNPPPQASAATGGYTGDWGGSEGKLAYIHQKELILNANDTANLLAAVGTLRDMTSRMSIGESLDALATEQSGLLSTLYNSRQQLDQNVHIEANFPNVRDHLEIEKAFDNLVNIASMYASKRQ